METLGAKPASLHELLRTADIVSLHAPLTPQNQGLIDRDELRMMRPGARIVNCARGGLIDEAALLGALDSGHVAGAALDVVSDEPPPADSLAWRLLAHPAVVATPHLGGATREAQARIAVDLCKDIMAVLAGRPPSAAVNAPVAADAQTRPFIELAYILGRTYPQIAADIQPRIALVLEGELRVLDPRAFTVGLLVGLLPQISERRVSAVNAEQVAQEMGIVVETLSGPCDRGFSRALSLRGGRTTLAGTVIHGEQQRLIEVDGFEVDLAPYGPVLMTRHQDVPGIVGRVGTILGAAEINIANMQVARSDAGGAIMLMGLERAPSADVLTQLRDIPHVESVRAIHL
jgi:D-3-phosphoglycerate dehydrogenase